MRRTIIKASSNTHFNLVEALTNVIDMIPFQYDDEFDTRESRIEAEVEAVCDAFGITYESARSLMIYELGYSIDDFSFD